jgi:AcrR family transcriptional regulator
MFVLLPQPASPSIDQFSQVLKRTPRARPERGDPGARQSAGYGLPAAAFLVYTVQETKYPYFVSYGQVMAKGIPDFEKRRMILDRSRMLFFDRGVSALSMEKIASLQGISKKTLYKFFANKDALLSAAVKERISAVAAEAARIEADPHLPWLQRLRGILSLVSRQIAELGESIIRDLYYHRPDLWAQIDAFRRERIFSIITRLLEEGRREGFIRKDINGRLVPLVFINAVSSVLTPVQIVNLPSPPAELFDAFVGILLGGVLTDGARRRFFTTEGKR